MPGATPRVQEAPVAPFLLPIPSKGTPDVLLLASFHQARWWNTRTSGQLRGGQRPTSQALGVPPLSTAGTRPGPPALRCPDPQQVVPAEAVQFAVARLARMQAAAATDPGLSLRGLCFAAVPAWRRDWPGLLALPGVQAYMALLATGQVCTPLLAGTASLHDWEVRRPKFNCCPSADGC